MQRTRNNSSEAVWARFDAMTDNDKRAAALADPDAQPLTDEDLQRAKLVPRVKIIRRALKLTQDEFAARYQIPVGTLRDWEQGRSEPDATGRAYLTVIAGQPDMVREELSKRK
jgi:putative transcriptional regulator